VRSPVGYNDDEARIKQLLEHVTTIEMSMNQIVMLEKNRASQSQSASALGDK